MEKYTPMESEFCSLEHDLYKFFERWIEKIADTISCDTMLFVNKSHVITRPDTCKAKL